MNSGFLQRYNICKGSKPVTTMDKLYIDFAASHDVIPSHSRLTLTLQHASDSFRLMSDQTKEGAYKLVIEKIELITYQVRLRDTLMSHIEHRLSTDGHLTYDVNRITCFGPIQVLQGTSIITKQLARGVKPALVICFFVRTQASEGLHQVRAQGACEIQKLQVPLACAHGNSKIWIVISANSCVITTRFQQMVSLAPHPVT